MHLIVVWVWDTWVFVPHWDSVCRRFPPFMVWYYCCFIISTYSGVIIPPSVGDPPHVEYFIVSPTYHTYFLPTLVSYWATCHVCVLTYPYCLAYISRLIFIVTTIQLIISLLMRIQFVLVHIVSLLCAYHWALDLGIIQHGIRAIRVSLICQLREIWCYLGFAFFELSILYANWWKGCMDYSMAPKRFIGQ